MIHQPDYILVIEDSDADFKLLEEALAGTCFTLPINRCKHGEEAVLYLTGRTSSCKLTMFVLMDINMPIMDGKQTLTILKTDPQTSKIPVAMLTVSNDPQDVEECYALGANTFINKSADYSDFSYKIKLLSGFWFDVAKLPSLQDDVDLVRLELMPKVG